MQIKGYYRRKVLRAEKTRRGVGGRENRGWMEMGGGWQMGRGKEA